MSYSFEQVMQLVAKFKKVGWKAKHIAQLGQASTSQYRAIEKVLNGKSFEAAVKAVATMQVKDEKTVDPAAALVTTPTSSEREALWVSPDLTRLVDLSPCEDDNRPLQLLHTVTSGGQGDGLIAGSVGGIATLTARRATPAQLLREVNLARDGEKGILKKGKYYLLYLKGPGGELVPVLVYWDDIDSGWCVGCYQFGQGDEWHSGDEVYGN